MTESPRWYIKKENYDAALYSLSRLNGLPHDSPLLRQEVEVIRNSISQEFVGASANPFSRTPNRHLNRTLIALGVNMFAQMTGVNISELRFRWRHPPTNTASHLLFERDLSTDLGLQRYNIACHLGMSADLAVLYGNVSCLLSRPAWTS